ncbi:MAG: metalloprotease TldD, partial [Pseudomonadota bacterium]|nr:metalloprotease TldD [Pseudomonadota bacterium]
MKQVDAHARAQDKRVSQVVVSLSGSYDDVLVAATDGTFAEDHRPLVRLNCSVIVEQEGRRE